MGRKVPSQAGNETSEVVETLFFVSFPCINSQQQRGQRVSRRLERADVKQVKIMKVETHFVRLLFINSHFTVR